MAMKEKLIKNIQFSFAIIIVAAILIFLFRLFDIKGFLAEVENKTFDLRQQVISKYKEHNKDIVILTVDDPGYEYIVSTYGAWPAPRDFWAKLAEGIEKVNPRAIVFDLLFVQNFKAYGNTDKALSNVIKGKNNIYVSMNFDNQNEELRKAIELPESLNTKISGDTDFLKKAQYINFKNVRGIIPEILYGTDNIGFINIARDKDGIIRTKLPLFVYKDKFYKHLTLLVALDLLNLDSKNLKIDGDKNLILSEKDKRIIPMQDDGKTYLNWYGPAFTYEYIPVWEVDKAIDKNDYNFLKEKFENKIVYVGVTTTSSSDVKTTPLSARYAGVEIHTTFLNNILDNNFIKKTKGWIDVLISLILAGLTGVIVYRSKSVSVASLKVFILIVLYTLLTLIFMHYMNLWAPLVLPIVFSIGTITASYAIKYIITSRDYEHTYKLAVTDALTDMYNHRYFQEQMKLNIDNSKRYNTPFSLIMIDIDFFKKFNDKYGHQSGDAVLRQVAGTIKKNIRSTDIPCRYGGEEMAVILTNTDKEAATTVALKICEAVRQREFELATGDWTHVTISLGVATMPNNADSVQGLIEYADKCLYIAKENGRNQVVSEIRE